MSIFACVTKMQAYDFTAPPPPPPDSNDSIPIEHQYVIYVSYISDITSSTANLKWLPDTAVIQYDINVYTGGEHFAQYLVDGNGQVISSQKFAPSIYYHKLDTTISSTDYYVITLNGLSAGTNYTYTIEGTNAQNVPIYHEGGSFKTLNEGEEGIFDAIADDPRKQARKVLCDGVLFFINPDGKAYTIMGQEVR